VECGRAIGRSGGPVSLLLLLAAGAPAQVAPNRATAYLHPSDLSDARALWINPAGLARPLEASVNADVTVGDPGAAGRLRQLTLGFNSRGLAFGYQRDVFASGTRGHTYRAGLAGAGAQGRLALGVAATLYRGAASGLSWDLGATYALQPTVSASGVIANLGQPTIRGVRQTRTYMPGLTWRPIGPRAALSAHARFSSDTTREGYAVGARWSAPGRLALGILAQLDTDRHLRRTALAVGLSVGTRDVLGVVATTAGEARRVEAASLWGVSTRSIAR
jgi:hypothetical protein